MPVGAKGGFVCKRSLNNPTREEWQAEGVACYQTFIRGLLDITAYCESDAVSVG